MADEKPALWVLGTQDDIDDYDPAAASAVAPAPGQTSLWSGPLREHYLKQKFGSRLEPDNVYIMNYSPHTVVVAFAPCNKQALQTERDLHGAIRVELTGGELSFGAAGKWEYVDFPTTQCYVKPAIGAGTLAAGTDCFTEQPILLPKGCDRAYVTISKQGDATQVWVQEAIIKGQEWGCIYGDPVTAAGVLAATTAAAARAAAAAGGGSAVAPAAAGSSTI